MLLEAKLLEAFFLTNFKGGKEMEEKRFITETEVSTITGMSVQTLRNWRFQGKGIPYVKAGRSVRYQYQDVITYMEERIVTPRDQS